MAQRPIIDDVEGDELVAAAYRLDAYEVGRLLYDGVDPNGLAGGGRTALSVAAEMGTWLIVEMLLRHGADPRVPDADGRLPYDIAAGRAYADVAAELERTAAAFVEGSAGSVVIVTTREDIGDAIQLIRVQVRGDDGSVTEFAMQTGHLAIVTDLETKLGMRVPFTELAERALSGPAEGAVWWAVADALTPRADAETFAAAARLCDSPRLLERRLGADVIGMFGNGDDMAKEPSFHARAVAILRRLADREHDPEMLKWVVTWLGHRKAPALPELLSLVDHDGQDVREAVARNLPAIMSAGHPDGLAALIRLSRDPCERVRDWATTGLAIADQDTQAIRAALTARLDDPHLTTALEAARGLAARGDHIALGPVHRLLTDSAAPGLYAYDLAIEVAEKLGATDLIAGLRTR